MMFCCPRKWTAKLLVSLCFVVHIPKKSSKETMPRRFLWFCLLVCVFWCYEICKEDSDLQWSEPPENPIKKGTWINEFLFPIIAPSLPPAGALHWQGIIWKISWKGSQRSPHFFVGLWKWKILYCRWLIWYQLTLQEAQSSGLRPAGNNGLFASWRKLSL